MLSSTLERLETFVHTLEESKLSKLSKLSNTLGYVFPACEMVKPPRFPMEDRWDLNYPMEIQPFSSTITLNASFEIGRDSCSYGRLAPLLLAACLKPEFDFKAYCSNFCTDFESVILSPSCNDHDTRVIEKVVTTWIDMCEIQKSDSKFLFRRCAAIGFTTDMILEKKKAHRAGHAIAIGLEMKERVLTLKIFDYRMHEYVHNVHDQLFQWMSEAVQKYSMHFDSLRTETVCLKRKLHVDGKFMTCMSAAFRVCLYFSSERVLLESDQDFSTDSLNLQRHIFRMFEWASTDKRLEKMKKTVLISPAMAGLIFEINHANCYLLLAPHWMPKRLNSKQNDCLAIVEDINRTGLRLRYSVKDGFVESES